MSLDPRAPLRQTRDGMRAALILLLVLVSAGACTPLDDAMVAIFGRSMRDQRAFDPYENPHLPAENAVPFAQGNYPAQLDGRGPGWEAPAADVPAFTQRAMAPPGADVVRTLENPVAADSASLARGRVVYDRFCAVCHGPAGTSADAPIVDKLPVMRANNLASGNATGYTDGYIYGMVRVGRGLMPAYGHRIPHVDRWHVVNYVRELQARAGTGVAGDGGPDPAGEGG